MGAFPPPKGEEPDAGGAPNGEGPAVFPVPNGAALGAAGAPKGEGAGTVVAKDDGAAATLPNGDGDGAAAVEGNGEGAEAWAKGEASGPEFLNGEAADAFGTELKALFVSGSGRIPDGAAELEVLPNGEGAAADGPEPPMKGEGAADRVPPNGFEVEAPVCALGPNGFGAFKDWFAVCVAPCTLVDCPEPTRYKSLRARPGRLILNPSKPSFIVFRSRIADGAPIVPSSSLGITSFSIKPTSFWNSSP